MALCQPVYGYIVWVQGKKVDTIIKRAERALLGGKNWSDSEKSEGFGGKDRHCEKKCV